MESLFLIFFYGRDPIYTAPAVNIGTFHSTEEPVLEAVVITFHFRKEVLGFLSVGVSVRRTDGLHNRKLVFAGGSAYLLLGSEHERSDNSDIFMSEVGTG